MPGHVGVDFDNTLVCYDEVFKRLAREKNLAPETHATKGKLRDYLRAQGKEDAWTELQGTAYGPYLRYAKAFPGAVEFIRRCGEKKVRVSIISHKTKNPYLGEKHDLHQAAKDWLKDNGLGSVKLHLELTKENKLERIGLEKCAWFIDDLPEFLAEPKFPTGVEKIFFDPEGRGDGAPFRRAKSWSEIESWIIK